MPVQDADGQTTASASANTRPSRRTRRSPSEACPELRCIWPQHVWSSGKSTSCPSRSNSRTTARPVSGKSVSFRQVTNSETRTARQRFPASQCGANDCHRRGRDAVYTQDFDPVSGSLGLTAIFAVLPLLTLFVLLGGLKWKAQWAALTALGVCMLVAIIVYGMPVGQTALSASEGMAFGVFPIMWIVIAAIWVYNMTVESGHFAVLRRSFGAISNDQRIQAVIVAFCFGALMEALAGFGTPVAITAVMLIALGFKPLKAASVALVANTAPVAFGAIAIPITTLAETSGLDKGDLGSMGGRQTPFLALIVPLILIGMVDGRRGIRQAWPVAVVGGLAFAIAQFTCSNFISVELTDIVASLFSTACIVAFLRVWSPSEPLLAEETAAAGRFQRPAVAGASVHDPTMERQIERRDDTRKDSTADVIRAYAPYAIIIAIFSIAQIPAVKDWLAESPWTTTFQWPGLDVQSPDGEALSSLTFNFNWLPAAGTLMLISGLITMAVLGLSPLRAVRVFA